MKNKIVNINISIQRILKLIRLIWNSHKILTIIWVLLTLLVSGFPALQIWLQKKTINSISQINLASSWNETLLLVLALYFSYISLALFNELNSTIFSYIGETVNFELKQDFLKKAVSIDLEYYEEDEFYHSVMMANESLNRNGIQVVNYIFTILQQLFSLFAVYSILASVHWSLPIALLSSSLPGIVFLFIAKNRRFKILIDTSSVAREMEYTNRIIIQKEFAREIRVFQLGEYLIERWGHLFNKVKYLRIKQSFNEAKGKVIGATILQISSALVAIFLIYQINQGHLTIGDYVALLGAAVSVQSAFGFIGMNLGNIVEISLYNNALFDFMNMESHSSTNEFKKKLNRENFDKILINNLSFRYPNSDRKILDDISLVINRGEHIAIVGENGAGKTTLINCIIGLYKITEGNIYFGETEIADINIDSLRASFSAVFQDFSKYYYNVRENVGFGDLSKIYNDEHIKVILNKLGLQDKVSKFPSGLDTRLGKQFHDGQELSGGEWQRIAIARALIRDAEIVILDEPTSALDPMAELDIFNCFHKATKDKTSVMISHRLGPVRFADRIIVLSNGKIVEEGSHEDLMKENGIYARMFCAQSKWYKESV